MSGKILELISKSMTVTRSEGLNKACTAGIRGRRRSVGMRASTVYGLGITYLLYDLFHYDSPVIPITHSYNSRSIVISSIYRVGRSTGRGRGIDVAYYDWNVDISGSTKFRKFRRSAKYV